MQETLNARVSKYGRIFDAGNKHDVPGIECRGGHKLETDTEKESKSSC